MKRLACLLLTALFFIPLPAVAETPAHDFLVLATFGGTQNGGDEAAFIDREGNLYYIDIEEEEQSWRWDETLARLRALPDDYLVGTLPAEELSALLALADGIGETEPTPYAIGACDAGVLCLTVYQRLPDGGTREITLLTAGDSVAENMDESALRLSTRVLELFSFTDRLYRWGYLFPYLDAVPLSLTFSRGSYFGGMRTFTLRRAADRLTLSVEGANGDDIDARVELEDYRGLWNGQGMLLELQALLDDLRIDEWDGFDGRNADVLDGDSFSLRIDYGTRAIEAKGYENFPDNYRRASEALEAFLTGLLLRGDE